MTPFQLPASIFCPTDNVTKSFSHKWKLVSDSTHINQIDSGKGWTWAAGPEGYYALIYALQNDNWVTIIGHLTHVTVGKSGVWGVNLINEIFFREAVTSSMPHGNNWRKLIGGLIQIDAGSSGVVYGVNR